MICFCPEKERKEKEHQKKAGRRQKDTGDPVVARRVPRAVGPRDPTPHKGKDGGRGGQRKSRQPDGEPTVVAQARAHTHTRTTRARASLLFVFTL